VVGSVLKLDRILAGQDPMVPYASLKMGDEKILMLNQNMSPKHIFGYSRWICRPKFIPVCWPWQKAQFPSDMLR
jgi:hypothetical protein